MAFIETIYVNSTLCHGSLILHMVPAISKAVVDQEQFWDYWAVELIGTLEMILSNAISQMMNLRVKEVEWLGLCLLLADPELEYGFVSPNPMISFFFN